MTTVDLADFLLARIDDDEEQARDAAGWNRAGHERATGRWQRAGISSLEDDERRSVIYDDTGSVSGDVADHIARWDPARVLAECDAKRRIIGYFTEMPTTLREAVVTDLTLRLLSLPYADHPDYREEWRP